MTDWACKAVAFTRRWAHEEDAVTAIEYGLLAALIAVVCISAFAATGTALSQVYTYWSNAVATAISG